MNDTTECFSCGDTECDLPHKFFLDELWCEWCVERDGSKMTETQAIECFGQFIEEVCNGETVKEYNERDAVATRETFNNWTDSLCKDGAISEELYNSITHPEL